GVVAAPGGGFWLAGGPGLFLVFHLSRQCRNRQLDRHPFGMAKPADAMGILPRIRSRVSSSGDERSDHCGAGSGTSTQVTAPTLAKKTSQRKSPIGDGAPIGPEDT